MRKVSIIYLKTDINPLSPFTLPAPEPETIYTLDIDGEDPRKSPNIKELGSHVYKELERYDGRNKTDDGPVIL